jgi:Family of unknown function (DUF6272)
MEKNLDFVKILSDKMRKHQFMLSYKGHVTQDITRSLLTLTERKISIDGVEVSTKKKIFNVMVECLQNISKHSEDKLDSDIDSLFMIGRVDDNYHIYSGNVILTENVNELTNKLMAVNVMNKEELSELYIRIIYEYQMSTKGTAGLGLIDIAKKSGNKLEYHFTKINEEKSYFTLKTTINNTQKK